VRTKFTPANITIAVLVILLVTSFLVNTSNADTNSNPGSVDDPIVTKGYVDDTVTKLVQQEVEKLGPIGGGSSAKIEVVTVPFGTKVIVEDGGELIVRSGKAVAYGTIT
jgi:hypothetical protein